MSPDAWTEAEHELLGTDEAIEARRLLVLAAQRFAQLTSAPAGANVFDWAMQKDRELTTRFFEKVEEAEWRRRWP